MSIRYHIFFSFSIRNIVQNKQNGLVQNTEFNQNAHRWIDIAYKSMIICTWPLGHFYFAKKGGRNMYKRYIGDRAFYRRVFAIALPMIIQNGITNFVNLLDNIMVGQLGATAMSGVSVVNQFIFIFNLFLYGANSGAGIFAAQFHGSGDHKGVRYAMRFKLLCGLLLTIVGGIVFALVPDQLIALFLQGEATPEQIAQTMTHGLSYVKVAVWGLLPFALSSTYSTTLRECGQAKIPMYAGIAAVLTNLSLNYVLIFGHFGAPAMGVRGAALATLISRFVELGIVAGYTHLTAQSFAKGLYRSIRIPGSLLKKIIIKGMPLLLNEGLWSLGITTLNQCYSTCGFNVVTATNIASTVSNLAGVVTMAMGNTLGILMGQLMGAGTDAEDIRDQNRKLLTLNVGLGVVFGGLLIAISGLFPRFYKTSEEIRHLATALICIIGAVRPFITYMYGSYYTLRSGGKTFITFLYDAGCLWALTVPTAFILSRYTNISILPLYMICQIPDMLKCILGAVLLKKGKWVQNLTK